MNKDNIALLARSALALLLAVHFWVWLRYIGAFWVNGGLEFLPDLLNSVRPLQTGLFAFLIFAGPVVAITVLVHPTLTRLERTVFYAFFGALFSTVYLLLMARLNLSFVTRQLWVYIAAGAAAGLVYSGILEATRSLLRPRNDAFRIERRKAVGALGLLAGSTGFLGALAGPVYFWRNRNKYIDVKVGHLQDGQLMAVELANKPVWILKRSPELMHLLERENPDLLDPRSEYSQQPDAARNPVRSVKPEYFVTYGICTHLGCAPAYLPEGRGDDRPCANSAPQFLCPCHGGVFDLAGRVYKGTPPPKNLAVPDYEFASEGVIRLYFPSLAQEWNA